VEIVFYKFNFVKRMSINSDINQSKFDNEHIKVMLNIVYSSNWITEKLKAVFDKEDFTSQQYNILRILRGAQKPLSTLQLRSRMLDKMSDTSRIVDRLVKKEFVKKIPSITDKRLVDISITKKGLALLKKLDGNETLDGGICKSLSVADAKALSILLDKMRG
jgi:DNA-binding MarR family transcriptional regulator